MTALTRFVLRHKALVALFWVAVAAVGVLTISGTTHRMTNNFAMPGQAFKVDNQIASQYGNGGSQAPYVPVITVPAGRADHRPGRGRGHRAGVRGAGPRDPARADRGLRDHRITRRSSPATAGPPSRWSTPPRSAASAAPTSARRSTAPWPRPLLRAGTSGSPARSCWPTAARSGQGHRDHGRGDDRRGRRAGHPGPGVRQLPGPAAAGHRRHLRAGHVPAGRRAYRGHRGQPDRRVPDRADRPGRGHRLLAAGGQPLARGAGRGPGQPGRRDRGDEPRGPGRGVLRPHRRHRAAVDDRPAGAHAAQRRLRRRAGAAGLGGGRRSPCCR